MKKKNVKVGKNLKKRLEKGLVKYYGHPLPSCYLRSFWRWCEELKCEIIDCEIDVEAVKYFFPILEGKDWKILLEQQ